MLGAVLFAPAVQAADVPASHSPPGGLIPSQVPQFVAVTFDDNFGLEDRGAKGGVRAVLAYYGAHRNPAGSGNPLTFDGLPIETTFFDTTIYMASPRTRVLGGAAGEDDSGGNLAAWRAAAAQGEEIGDHTVNHFNGGVVPGGADPCCRARNWDASAWAAEIGTARDMLTGPGGVGVAAVDVAGFRAPYLGYTDALFAALQKLGFRYDSSLPDCFAADEDGASCGWPYTLDAGSADAAALAARFTGKGRNGAWQFPAVTPHPGLWEVPPTTLIVPPDAMAAAYHFAPGLRQRIARRVPMPYPSLYEPATGKIVGMDYTLLTDAGVRPDEMRAILEYTLDQHLAGNRAPLVFVAHSHLYAYSSPDDNPDTPSEAVRQARWSALTAFLDYALARPEVRIVSARKLLDWMEQPVALVP